MIYVINLDRSPERWARVSQQLRAMALPFERFAAVDARAFTPHQAAQLDDAGFRRLHGMPPLKGELGCYLSHVEVMKRFLGTSHAFALILEDDVTLTERLPAALNGLMQHPQRWDMVKMSAVHSGTPRPYLEVAPGQHLAVMMSRCTGSSAYLINRHAAERYVASLLPMQLPYDHVFDRGWAFGLKVRLLTPTPCVHGHVGDSTIMADGPTREKFHWTRRLSTFAHRLGNEWQRLTYGLREHRRERRSV